MLVFFQEIRDRDTSEEFGKKSDRRLRSEFTRNGMSRQFIEKFPIFFKGTVEVGTFSSAGNFYLMWGNGAVARFALNFQSERRKSSADLFASDQSYVPSVDRYLFDDILLESMTSCILLAMPYGNTAQELSVNTYKMQGFNFYNLANTEDKDEPNVSEAVSSPPATSPSHNSYKEIDNGKSSPQLGGTIAKEHSYSRPIQTVIPDVVDYVKSTTQINLQASFEQAYRLQQPFKVSMYAPSRKTVNFLRRFAAEYFEIIKNKTYYMVVIRKKEIE